MDSPPKRMTRARAAARANADTAKPTRIVTAAAKARPLSTASVSSKSASAKRKVRDDIDEMDGTTTRRAVRARPDNRDETAGCSTTSIESVSRECRSRATRRTTVVVPDDGHVLTVSRTRGRARKPTSQERTNPMLAAPKMNKKTIQTRTGGGTVSKTSRNDSKLVTRNIVNFPAPEKENLSLNSKTEETSSNIAMRGPRGRPTGRAIVPVQSSRKSRQKPLSPKKVTQMPISRDKETSDDELSGLDGMSMAVKSPKRISTSELLIDKEAEDRSIDHEDEKHRDAAKLTAGPGPAAFGSPPRRAPPSPPTETLKSPPKRAGGLHLPELDLQNRIISIAKQDTQTLPGHSNFLLQSPARRPHSPIKCLNFPTRSFGTTIHQEYSNKSCFMLQSPPKRAMSAALPQMQPPVRAGALLPESQKTQPMMTIDLLVPPSEGPSDLLLAEDSDTSIQNSTPENLFDARIESPCVSGPMLAMLSSHTDSHFVEPAADELGEDIQPVWSGDTTSSETEDHGASEVILGEGRSICQEQPRLQLAGMAPEAANDDYKNLQHMIAEMEQAGEDFAPTDKSEVATDKWQCGSNLRIQGDIVDSYCNLKSDIVSDNDEHRGDTISVMHDKEARRTCYVDDSIYATRKQSRRSPMGLQSSAEQPGSWSAISTFQLETSIYSIAKDLNSTVPKDDSHNPRETFRTDSSPVRSTFFEDEIMVHTDFSSPKKQSMPAQSGECENGSDEDIITEDIAMLDEDVALAQEANFRSPMLQQISEEITDNRTCEETLSEASQEYGDENELPVRTPHVTIPSRPVPQTALLTTTKVPLKPADDSESSPLKKKSFSGGRTSHRNAGILPRRVTVISCSPTKDKRRASTYSGDMFCTPIKADQQSSIDMPGTQPRRVVDSALLRGCIVLVDVHTTEGADASGIFVELLTHMGAKCVKTWHWNPSGSGNGDSSSSKVGITHVVFKDGGKRTMEKVREARGLVHCVGVSWVLDCERENEWLDEAPYYLDISVIPRGGARRRKSMEPKALTNLNGTIVSSDNKTFEPLSTPKNRRESTLWMHTPPEQGAEDDDEDLEWSCALLTPVPKTPASEAVAKYASELPITPSSEEDPDLQSSAKQSLLTRTCPPKEGMYHDLEHGILSRDKDEQVIVRLMAARRKSLQFAPKIGSPLARTWN
ncbi:hypothetical protein E4U43_002056 [Claviceps pusilla]|uniref:BRCT domain-containing protein n=1 Tax=Claviceps pusilla TaxID=123648 RepID=A0A9P7T055_9HYPO|nr:hypothetical protein E4U43_002056 [Claviceps pusilla]